MYQYAVKYGRFYGRQTSASVTPRTYNVAIAVTLGTLKGTLDNPRSVARTAIFSAASFALVTFAVHIRFSLGTSATLRHQSLESFGISDRSRGGHPWFSTQYNASACRKVRPARFIR